MAERGRRRGASALEDAGRGGSEGTPPQDRLLDRRLFLERMGLLTAAAASGTALAPARLGAYPVGNAGTGAGSGPPPPTGEGLGPGAVRWHLPDPHAVQATQPWEMTLAELAAQVRTGSLSPAELVDAYLSRIEALDATLQAFNTVVAEAARAEARRLSQLPWAGPLHGIPLAIKDNYYTRGVLTTANSHIYRDFVPDYDAEAWARLKGAGPILLGKTQMGPLATSRATTPDGEPTTRNAWAPLDPSVDPGGSSSGSATAVAARMAASSTGTQTGGSITNPSSQQGLTGLKPTMGRVSLHGIVPLSYTRDHPGPLARDAMDAALMLQHMAGPDPRDPRTLGLPPVPDLAAAATPARRGSRTVLRWPTTLGVLPGYLDVPAQEEEDEPGFAPRRAEDPAERERRRRLGAARRAMVATFEALGARVVEVALPDEWELLTNGNFNNVRLPERAEPFLGALRRDVRLFGVALSPWIHGLLLSGAEYVRGQRAKMVLLERVLDGSFSQCDAVVQTAPIPFDMIGLPLIAFPIGFEESRGYPLPIAALVGGLTFGEERLHAQAAAYQAETDWHRRKPADPASGSRPGPAPDGTHGGPAGAAVVPRRLDVLDVLEACE
ncbi:MAG: amidase [Gemmatimonadetes bacterium]|nr:amidase [Gemmatimonadota bacterium]